MFCFKLFLFHMQILRRELVTERWHWLLALAGGLLLHFSWYPMGQTALVFLAFVPFFYIKDHQSTRPFRAFGLYFFGFLVFHIGAGWWMYSSTFVGSLLAHIFNATYMALVIFVWMKVSGLSFFKRFNYFIFIVLWLFFEFLHQRWELAWPWFTLGHVFAEKTQWIQWYSFTGALGGSLWVLLANILLYETMSGLQRFDVKRNATMITALVVVFAGPVLLSKSMKNAVGDSENTIKVLVVQPNIHPQKEKFAGMTAAEQLHKAIQLVESNPMDSVDLVLFPETMLIEALDEAQPDSSGLVRQLKMLAADASASILTGAYTKRFAGWNSHDQNAVVMAARPYVLYNSAVLISGKELGIYHKEKLVPLVEKQPFQWLMQPLRSFIESSGGFFGSYGTFNEKRTFLLNDSVFVRPVICFESAFPVFSETVSPDKFGFIAIITNDGWWQSRGGYYQHLMLARLRAIESGMWVVRSANTGVSAVIDPRGNIRAQCEYGTAGAFFFEIPLMK